MDEFFPLVAKIPLDFIESYVREQGKIKEVMLECESSKCKHAECGQVICDCGLAELQLKLRSDGTVIIREAEEKKFTASEVLNALNNPFGAGAASRDGFRARVLAELGLG